MKSMFYAKKNSLKNNTVRNFGSPGTVDTLDAKKHSPQRKYVSGPPTGTLSDLRLRLATRAKPSLYNVDVKKAAQPNKSTLPLQSE